MQSNLSRISLAALVVLLTLTTLTAHAQYTESVLYNFGTITNDGRDPGMPLIADGQGNFYSTTIEGGANNLGTVFELSPNGSGGWNETIIYSFAGSPDGASPYDNGLTFDSHGNLFGTTFYGGRTGGNTCGTLGCGAVFELSPNGSGGWTEQVLYQFSAGVGGYYPVGNLVVDANGNLFGAADYGGARGRGTIYELSPSSSGWTFNVIYFLQGAVSGSFPTALTSDASGNLYSTSYSGGNGGFGSGTVFRLSPSGSTWTYTKLFQFLGPGGATPGSILTVDASGNLYGTTTQGGKSTSACYGGGCGLTYMLTPTASGPWTEHILHEFTGGEDGYNPSEGVVLDSAGNVYGTAYYGGSNSCGGGCGTVYELSPVSGGWKFSRLFGFTSSTGTQPNGVIVDVQGHVYGTTQGGPLATNCIYSYGCGTVFEVSPPAARQK
jgi:uncharacterized repeat protein (TIGR03803 family)